MEAINRLPYLTPEEMDAAQRAFYDDVVKNMGSPDLPHIWMLPGGSLNGPFTSMLHFPEIGMALYNLQRKLVQQKRIDKRIAELVILTVVCHEGAAYGIYAHKLLARKAGLEQEKIDALLAGQCPPALTPDERAAYELACALCAQGSVSDEVYNAAQRHFDAEGIMTLIYTAGLFKFLGTLLNAYNEPTPE